MHREYTPAFLARFWAKVDRDGSVIHPDLGPCWPSSSAPTKAGYARYGLNYALIYAHHISWEIHFGPIPDGLKVLHHCDNPPCVRPDHLFVGTQADNMRDMRAKARHSHGEAHRAIMREKAARGDRNGSRTHPERLIGRKMKPFTIRPDLIRRGEASGHVTLTEAIVREMRRAWDAGEATQAQLAARYNVTQTNISLIVRRKSWQHVE